MEKLKKKKILKVVKKYIRKLSKAETPVEYKFHRYSYFKDVVENAEAMAEHYDLSEEDREVLLLANWFRFSGMIKEYNNYQEQSVLIAEEFLTSLEYPIEQITKVKDLILSTQRAANAGNRMEEITQDAAVIYLGKKRFFRRSSLLRIELEETNKQLIKNKEWANIQFEFLTGTHFITDYAILKYDKRKAENIQKQRKLMQKATTAAIRKKTGKEFGRGIDTLYRVTYRNHINLSSIADGKANMMISINTLILSGVIALFGTSVTFSGQYTFDHFRYLVPTLILLLFAMISAIFAVLSARPKVSHNPTTTEDILKRNKSVLFFGNFIGMDKMDFIDSLDLLKRNQNLLYDNMAVDVYYLGHVLDKKYLLLKHSYNTFMVGLVLCVLSFVFILMYTQSQGI